MLNMAKGCVHKQHKVWFEPTFPRRVPQQRNGRSGATHVFIRVTSLVSVNGVVEELFNCEKNSSKNRVVLSAWYAIFICFGAVLLQFL